MGDIPLRGDDEEEVEVEGEGAPVRKESWHPEGRCKDTRTSVHSSLPQSVL